MALRIMSAIVPNTSGVRQEVNHSKNRAKLQEDLLAAAKLCHFQFGSRRELATESDHCVSELCAAFEAIFKHGFKSKSIDKLNLALRHVSELVSGVPKSSMHVAFWPCIKEYLTWHEQERFTTLKNVHSDSGRGRAWLRAALNERSLERHLHSMINSESLKPFYEDWAFLLDQERSEVLPNVAAGLGTILFAIRVDNDEFDDKPFSSNRPNSVSQSEPVISTLIVPRASTSKKKKVPTRIIIFDDDDQSDDHSINNPTSISAPPTCLNSPVSKDLLPASNSPRIPTTANPNQASTSSWQLEESPETLSQRSSPVAEDSDSPTNVDNSLKSSPDNCNKVNGSWSNEDISEEISQAPDGVLTPLTDMGSLGGLVPVSPLDQTLDDFMVSSNYLEEILESTNVLEPEVAFEAVDRLDGINCHVSHDELDIEGLRVRLLAMGELLEQSRDDAISTRLQLARLQRQHQNYLERHEVQVQAMNRENELLRQQLRKYVTAVQMLKKDSDDTSVTNDQSTENRLDNDYESQHYQNQLVQVAEMHAELMEFNNRLTMQLTNKDNLVKRLQMELESLRGPLNENYAEDSQCLIHIWVPSAFLTGEGSDVHHVYQIYIRIKEVEWNIYRRYAQFHALCRELKRHDTVMTTFEFPPKKTLGNKDAKFVEDRRRKLQQWLRRVAARLARCSQEFIMRPSKQTLITLIPFFGDHPSEDSRNSNSVRNNLSSSPQYMGL